MTVIFLLFQKFLPDSTSGIYELNESPHEESSKKLESSKMIKRAEVAVPKKQKEPELPDVYWSELNKNLLALEQERTAIMTMVIPKSSHPQTLHNIDLTIASRTPKHKTQEKSKTLIKLSSKEPAEMTWALVGHRLIELEQERKNTITSLSVKVNQIENVE